MPDDGRVGVAVLVREPLAAGCKPPSAKISRLEDPLKETHYFVRSACPVPV